MNRLVFSLLVLFLAVTQMAGQSASTVDPDCWVSTYEDPKKGRLLFVNQDGLLLPGLGEQVTSCTLEIARDDKKATGIVPFQVIITYDDLVQEKVNLQLDSLAQSNVFRLELTNNENRNVQDVQIRPLHMSQLMELVSFSYTKGTRAHTMLDSDFADAIFYDQSGTRNFHNVLVIPSPVSNPPHLMNLRHRKVTFTASIAGQDPKAVADTASLTLNLVDLGEYEVEIHNLTINREVQEYTFDLGSRDLTYGFLLTFQPMPGQPSIAIRRIVVSD